MTDSVHDRCVADARHFPDEGPRRNPGTARRCHAVEEDNPAYPEWNWKIRRFGNHCVAPWLASRGAVGFARWRRPPRAGRVAMTYGTENVRPAAVVNWVDMNAPLSARSPRF